MRVLVPGLLQLGALPAVALCVCAALPDRLVFPAPFPHCSRTRDPPSRAHLPQ